LWLLSYSVCLLMMIPLLILALPLLDYLFRDLHLCFFNLKVLHEAVHLLNWIAGFSLLPVLSFLRSRFLLATIG